MGGLETKHRKAGKDCGWGGGLETKHRKAEKDCGWGEVWRRNIGKQRKIVDGGGGGLETKHRKAGKDCGWGGGSGDET